ncbi:MAG: cell wall hydrolase [Bacilli bacterium]|nr:cell wall hydrolase [Bacilli bacterium]
MRRKVSNLIVIASQLSIVGLFFVTIFSNDIKVQKYVNIIHNENLNKIATSVSILFEEEIIPVQNEIEDLVLEELPSLDIIEEDIKTLEENKKEEEPESTPLVSVDASKYSSREEKGFKVTEGNKEYDLSGYEFDVVVAVVAGEYDKNLNDALAVVSVILNRCDSKTWAKWAGSSPYTQVIAPGQFEVYFRDYYLPYMPGGSRYGSEKYEVAKQALIDGMNGIRNNSYLGFRAGYLTNYSDKYIVDGGNRYGYN